MGSFADRLVDGIDYVFRALGDLCFSGPPSNLVDLETVDTDRVLVARGGTLVSVIQLRGFKEIMGNAEFQQSILSLTNLFGLYLKSGSPHLVKIIYESDPDGVRADLEKNFAPVRQQARRLGLDVDDLIDEKIQRNAQYCHAERVFLVVYTREVALGERQKVAREEQQDENKVLPNIGSSQNLVNHLQALRLPHMQAVDGIVAGLVHAGYSAHVVRSDEVLTEIIREWEGPEGAAAFEPDIVLDGDMLFERQQRNKHKAGRRLSSAVEGDIVRRLRKVTNDNNLSLEPVFPRPLREQLVGENIRTIDNRLVVSSNRIYAPVQVVTHAESPSDFDALLRSLKGIPFRIAFTLTPDGLAGDYVRNILGSSFSWASAANKQINTARKQLQAYENDLNGVVVGLSMMATTWASVERAVDSVTGRPVYDTREIDQRCARLVSRLRNWGGVLASPTTPDAVEAVLSTMPGLIGFHVAEPTPAPLPDVVAQLPIGRAVSAWKRGTALYRTIDGTPIAYEQYSGEQAAWITLIIGPMGLGKSAQIFSLNFAYLIQPSDTDSLPYLRGLDFGPSSKGLIDIVRAGLPADQRHKAIYVAMKNDERYSFNTFDLPLGNRVPLPNHVTFLKNFIASITYSMRNYPNLQGLIGLCIKQLYKQYSDFNHNPAAKRYSRGMSRDVDRRLHELRITAVEGQTTWWSLVDRLFELGDSHAASLAQRYAMPILDDLAGIAVSADVVAEYGETWEGRPVTSQFSRAIREAIEDFPFLRTYTRFDISESPIVSLDLAGMMPPGGARTEREMVHSAVIYLVALRILNADFFLSDEYLPYFNGKYASYHAERLSKLKVIKKRLFCDEKHRIKGVTAAETQLDQLIVEGRKFFIDLVQASQDFDDFSKKTQNLATTIVLCGVGSVSAAKQVAEHYGLTNTHEEVLRSIRKPNAAGSQMLAIFKTASMGEQKLSLMNTEGSQMLCAMATEAPDRYVRDELYKFGSTSAARRVFAAAFPGGSVKGELQRRTELMGSGDYTPKSANLLDDIVAELAPKIGLSMAN